MEDHTIGEGCSKPGTIEVVTLRQPCTSIGFSRQGEQLTPVD